MIQLTDRQLAALRACLLYPQGMRRGAYPTAMAALMRLGFVISRPAQGPGRKMPAWFITPDGQRQLALVDGARPRVRRGAPD